MPNADVYMSWLTFFIFWKDSRYSTPEKIPGTIFVKKYSWKDSRYSTPEKIPGARRSTTKKIRSNGTLCASATRTPLLNRSGTDARPRICITYQANHIRPMERSSILLKAARPN
jgi:hypothetical protein